MLRNKVPTTYEEKIMSKTGKIIWFPSVEEGLVNERVFPEDALFKQDDLYSYEEQEGLSREEIDDKLARIKKGKMNRGFFSQLYCPILYNEYFIGYIYLLNRLERNIEISLDIVKYVYEFSRIL